MYDGSEACRGGDLPQFTLRFNRETPECVWDAAMRCIEEGRTYRCSGDDVLVPGLMNAFHVSRERAETYVPHWDAARWSSTTTA